MKVKDLIVALLDTPMDAEVLVTVPDQHEELSVETVEDGSTRNGAWVYLITERPE